MRPELQGRAEIQSFVVTSAQMQAIEGRVFAAGMPVAALMEKVAGRITQRVQALIPPTARVGVLVGPGHNGGDALVVARELYLRGYQVKTCCPFSRLKDLTQAHANYLVSLGVPTVEREALQDCDVLIDGLFGFGLARALEGGVRSLVEQVNQQSCPIISIDLPSGLHTDTGQVLGTAIRATYTLCLGLWKLGLLQEHALEFVGQVELIDFDLPLTDIQAVLGETPPIVRVTDAAAIAPLPLHRPPTTHKYKMGHLLLICGSERYAGGALLTGLGARASGVGMLSIAVPASLKPLLVPQLPDALIIGCPETESGAIASLPPQVDLAKFQALACGPGLTTAAGEVVQRVLGGDRPLVLDADGLNILAQIGTMPTLQTRTAPTILTPHQGEFQRLFPEIELICRITGVRTAARQSGAIVLLKGARVAIADPQGHAWINPTSTPALARGGSGDVLTGLMGGLLAQNFGHDFPIGSTVASAAWWHAQAGIRAAQERTELGVDAHTLTQYLLPAIQPFQGRETVPRGGYFPNPGFPRSSIQ